MPVARAGGSLGELGMDDGEDDGEVKGKDKKGPGVFECEKCRKVSIPSTVAPPSCPSQLLLIPSSTCRATCSRAHLLCVLLTDSPPYPGVSTLDVLGETSMGESTQRGQ